MDLLLDLMNRVISLMYDVNNLMKHVNESMDLSFIEASENGHSIDNFKFKKKEHRELFEKRNATFAINDRIMRLVSELSSEEKDLLVEKLIELRDYNHMMYIAKFEEYQEMIDKITQPSFSFEGNQIYKDIIISLKDQYNRYEFACTYYENMLAYAKPQRKSK